jgi:DNA-binding CsgD family transcriptional regulator/DNA polymerase III delta prime subunit
VEATGVGEVVGRERELEELEEFLDSAREAPQALLLEGEPGIGKTTLWRAAVESGRERGFRTLTARPAEAEATLSFAALGDVLRDADDAVGALPEPQRRALRIALLLEEHEGAGIDGRAVSVALLRLLRELARDQPILVAVDDVQWLDPPTAAALTFALRRVGTERITFLGTARPAQARLRLEALGSARIGPLDGAAIDSILQRALEAPLVRPLVRRLNRASGGNPFYALELARSAVDDATDIGLTDPVPLPASLEELLRARLTALPQSSRHALAAVAALAQPTRTLIEQSVGSDARGLEAARNAGIVAFENGDVRFTHPLLASAAYGDLEPQRRCELHRQLAAVVSDPEERARHLALAAEAPDAAVATALEEASVHAFSRGATESAAALLERSLQFTPPACAAELHRRRLAAAGYLARTGAKAQAQSFLDQANRASGPGPDRARVALTAAWYGLYDASSCIDALQNAIDDARDDPLLLLKIHGALTPRLLYARDLDGAAEHAATAAELAEQVGDDAHLVLALVGVAHVALLAGKGLDRKRLERAVELEGAAGNPYGNVTVARSMLAEALGLVGELEGARQILEEKAAEERRRADIGLAWTLQDLARVETDAGNWHGAEALAEESLEISREVDDVLQQALAHRALADVAALRGQVRRTRERISEGVRLADVAQTPLTRAHLTCTLGFLEVSLDNHEVALSELERVAQLVVETGIREPGVFRYHSDYIEALIAVGNLEKAEAAANELLADAAALDRKTARVAAFRSQGQLAAARGRFDDAIEVVAEARACAGELEQPFELARTLLVEGTLLRRAKRRVEARATLIESLKLFEELGAALWAQRARNEIARLGGRARQTAKLTTTEQQVAELVATGKSNHEVAQALHVSPKTVEWNLSKIYKKLRVSSRTELAATLSKPRA